MPAINERRLADGRGGEIRALMKGEGPAVVMLHGAYLNAADWKAAGLIEAIAASGRRAVALDRPDQGRARTRGRPAVSPGQQAAHLRAATGVLKLDRPILLAHSYGAAVALAWAIAAPEAVAGLVLVNPASHPWGGGDESWHNRLAMTPLIGPLFVHAVIATLGRATVRKAAENGFAPDTPPTGYAEAAEIARAVRPRAYRATAASLMRADADFRIQARLYGTLNMPILALTGDRDRVVSPWIHARALAHDAPRAETWVAKGHGHNLHHARPDLILKAVDHVAARGAIHPRETG